jgi:hypothetical protein
VVLHHEHTVLGVHQHDPGLVVAHLGLGDPGVGGDDHLVPHLGQAGGGTVHAADAAAARALDEVGREAAAAVHVVHLDALEGHHVAGVHEVGIQGEAPS